MKELMVAIDGASRGNPGASGIGVVVYDNAGKVIREIGEYIGVTTNNVAEYSALIRGLQEAIKMKADIILVQTDSELLAMQIAGKYRVKSPKLAPLYATACSLFTKFKKVEIVHVRRELNAHADRLASDSARRRADYNPDGKPTPTRKKNPTPSTVKPRKQVQLGLDWGEGDK